MSEANNNLSAENLIFPISSEQNLSSESKLISNTPKDQDIDWHKLAHKLREHNRKLLKKVFQLEQEVIESEQALKEQKKLSHSNDLYAAKQAEKINHYQEQIADLAQKIETSHQETHSQQVVIETLTQQLDSSQQKAAKLEKECTELQEVNKTKSERLLAQQQQIQELTNRLNRQQQHIPHKQSDPERVASQPIKPWSANIEAASFKSAVFSPEVNPLKPNDWPAPAISHPNKQINSIAAVKLPRFPRQAEAE